MRLEQEWQFPFLSGAGRMCIMPTLTEVIMQKWEYLELRTRSSEWELNGKPLPETRSKDFSLVALWNKAGR